MAIDQINNQRSSGFNIYGCMERRGRKGSGSGKGKREGNARKEKKRGREMDDRLPLPWGRASLPAYWSSFKKESGQGQDEIQQRSRSRHPAAAKERIG